MTSGGNSADVPTDRRRRQTRFWTPNLPDPPVSWKTRLKFDRTKLAEVLINFKLLIYGILQYSLFNGNPDNR